MSFLLYLGLTQKQYWQRSAQGWQSLNGKPPPDKPVWVVTNLAEEGYAEVEIPRVSAPDRKDLLQRQLATHFPETAYRARIAFPHGKSLLDKLAPTQHTLFGITNAQKIDDILDEEDIQVAALCPTSLLLAQLGNHKTLPETLFVVLSDTESLRIVFIKNRIPNLTRLAAIPGPDQVHAQIDEIIRTHRYLENTRALEKGQRLPVLLLGSVTETAEFLAPLSQAGLSIVAPPPSWNIAPPANGYSWAPVFDLAMRHQPCGQLAPIERRTRHLASRMRRHAWIAGICLVFLGLSVASLHTNDMRSILREKEQTAATIATLDQQSTELDRQTAAFGASSDLIRRALALDTHEMLEAPSFEHQLAQVAHAIQAATDTSAAGHTVHTVRLNLLNWAISAPGATPCAEDRTTLPKNDANGAAAPTTSPTTPPLANDPSASPPQQAQISFDLSLPSGLTQRSRLDLVRSISTHLKEIPDIQLWGDPNIGLSHATLKGGAQASTDETPLRWCMTLSNPTLPAESPTP